MKNMENMKKHENKLSLETLAAVHTHTQVVLNTKKQIRNQVKKNKITRAFFLVIGPFYLNSSE